MVTVPSNPIRPGLHVNSLYNQMLYTIKSATKLRLSQLVDRHKLKVPNQSQTYKHIAKRRQWGARPTTSFCIPILQVQDELLLDLELLPSMPIQAGKY
jgi:hypothetical protein